MLTAHHFSAALTEAMPGSHLAGERIRLRAAAHRAETTGSDVVSAVKSAAGDHLQQVERVIAAALVHQRGVRDV